MMATMPKSLDVIVRVRVQLSVRDALVLRLAGPAPREAILDALKGKLV